MDNKNCSSEQIKLIETLNKLGYNVKKIKHSNKNITNEKIKLTLIKSF